MFLRAVKRRPLIGHLPEAKRKMKIPPPPQPKPEETEPEPPPPPAQALKQELFGDKNPGWEVTNRPVIVTNFEPVIGFIRGNNEVEEFIAVLKKELPNTSVPLAEYKTAMAVVHLLFIKDQVIDQTHNGALVSLLARALYNYHLDQESTNWQLYSRAYVRALSILIKKKSS